MGRIKTQLAKRVGQELFDTHSTHLSGDFVKNKEYCATVADIPSKKLRNVIIGYVTRLAKRAAQQK